MLHRNFKKLLKMSTVTLLLVTSIVTANTVSAKASGITGADWPTSNNGITGTNPTNLYGTSYSTFNRFVDSMYLCRIWGHFVNGVCTDKSYADEREFLTVRKLGIAKADGTVEVTNRSTPGSVAPTYHNYTSNDLKEGDVVRAYIYVHNNASTIYQDSRYVARDVRVSVSTQGSKVVSTIKAKNTFTTDPGANRDPNAEATFTDDAYVQLPSGLGLEIYKRSSSTVNGFVEIPESCSDTACTAKRIGNPVDLSSNYFSMNGSTLTYHHGDMIGSKVHASFMYIDLKVVKVNQNNNNNGNDNTNGGQDGKDKPGTYQECINGTSLLRFVWDEAQVGDTLTVVRTRAGSTTEENFTYTVQSSYGMVYSHTVRNAYGEILRVQAGDKIRWRVGNGTRYSRWYEDTVRACDNLSDNLRLINLAPCASPTFKPTFAWDTPGVHKRLDVSTDESFSFYWSKNISNLNSTTGPEGFTYFETRSDKPLVFKGEVTYYWRIVEDGKIYRGTSFKVPFCNVECIDNGYQGPDDTCDDDGNIIEHDDEECRVGVCACIEIEVNPSSAGDFNTATFTVNVSNRAITSQTIAKKIEVKNLRPDGKKGYTLQSADKNWIFLDDTCTNGKTSEGLPCEPLEEGSFQVTGVKATNFVRAAGRPSDAEDITVDFAAFAADQTKPVIVNNLYPGDSVDLEVTGQVRTSKDGKAFSANTTQVNYTYFMKSPSNNGRKALTIARPYLLTTNDGDILRTAMIKGLSRFETVYKDVFGRPLGGAASGLNTEGENRVNQTNLGFGNNLSGMVIVQDQNKSGGTANLSSEADFMNKLNIRPDRTRIFSTRNQNVEIGSTALPKVEIADSSTIYVEFTGQRGTVTINSDITYKTGTNRVPSFALVVKNGDIVIHPKVKQLDGVYVALGTAKFASPSNWKQYYESGNQPETLVVNGALYGNIESLIPSRPNLRVDGADQSRDGLIRSSGIAINFDGRIYSYPAPGLREIIGGVYELLRGQN